MTHLSEWNVTLWLIMHMELISFNELETPWKNHQPTLGNRVLFYPLNWITQALYLLQQVHGQSRCRYWDTIWFKKMCTFSSACFCFDVFGCFWYVRLITIRKQQFLYISVFFCTYLFCILWYITILPRCRFHFFVQISSSAQYFCRLIWPWVYSS